MEGSETIEDQIKLQQSIKQQKFTIHEQGEFKLPKLIDELKTPSQSKFCHPPRVAVVAQRFDALHKKARLEKLLLETLLARVQDDDKNYIIHIELSFSRPEFCLPGVIGVTKVDQQGHHQILTSTYLGSLNPEFCTVSYQKSLKEFRSFLKQYENVPWILHTTVFTRGPRQECGIFAFDTFRPTHIIVTDRVIPKSVHRLTKYYKVIHMDEDIPGEATEDLSGDVARYERFHEYFLSRDSSLKTVSLQNFGIGDMFSTMPYFPRLRSMNRNLVALCHFDEEVFQVAQHCEDEEEDDDDDDSTSSESEEQKGCETDNNNKDVKVQKWIECSSRFPNTFIAYAVVKSIKFKKFEVLVELITPLSQEMLLNRVNCIVSSDDINFDFKLRLQMLNLFCYGVDDQEEVTNNNYCYSVGTSALSETAVSTLSKFRRVPRIVSVLSKLIFSKRWPVLEVRSRFLTCGLICENGDDITCDVARAFLDKIELSGGPYRLIAEFIHLICYCTTKVLIREVVESIELGRKFRRHILNECQKRFEELCEFIFSTETEPMNETKSKLELKKKLGLVEFIGELYNFNMITQHTIQECVTQLLGTVDDFGLRCLCVLLKSVGYKLEIILNKEKTERLADISEESDEGNNDDDDNDDEEESGSLTPQPSFLDEVFYELQKKLMKVNISERNRNAIVSLMELRGKGWILYPSDPVPYCDETKLEENIVDDAHVEEDNDEQIVYRKFRSK